MFPLYQASGFYCAPVSKALVSGSVLASIAFNFPLAHLKPYLRFSFTSIFEHYEIWRYLACRCVFLEPKDILCAGVILYHFRIFERRYGSLKFASHILCQFFLSMLIELGFLAMLHQHEFDIQPLPSGPYGLVFSLYIGYYCDIPRVAYTQVMGVPVTGKSLTYIIGLQLMSGSLESMLLATIGLFSGCLVKCNFLYVNHWFRIPRLAGRLCAATLGRLLHTPRPTESDTPIGATIEIQRQQRIERLEQQLTFAQQQPRPQGLFGLGLFRGNRAPNQNGFHFMPRQQNAAPQMAAVPSDEQVQRLVEMGFNRENVMNALRVSNNNINAATNILLNET